ncbi:MAG: helix-turn-helix domain-containing protein [Clostridia bacterium]|nr:helix-turn-helix domain-containing protein [Clostridia bacterium]
MSGMLNAQIDRLAEMPRGAAGPDQDGFYHHSGQLLLPTRGGVLRSMTDTPDRKDIMKLLRQLQNAGSVQQVNDKDDAWRRILSGIAQGSEATALAERFSLEDGHERLAMVFRPCGSAGLLPADQLRAVAPLDDDEYIVTLDPETTVLLKKCEAGETSDDDMEFALALRETLESETGIQTVIGIGTGGKTAARMAESCAEALQALRIGRMYHDGEQVYLYEKLLLERILAELPAHTAAKYRDLFYTPAVRKLMDREMTETVYTFFRQDLNIADTARQLFIHRNTLIYRLDKIMRVTGLDLRRFDDAVLFRILTELPDTEQN